MAASVDGRWPQCNLAKGNDLATTTIPNCFAEPDPRVEGAERFTCGIECPDAYSDSVVLKVRGYKVNDDKYSLVAVVEPQLHALVRVQSGEDRCRWRA